MHICDMTLPIRCSALAAGKSQPNPNETQRAERPRIEISLFTHTRIGTERSGAARRGADIRPKSISAVFECRIQMLFLAG